MDTVFLDKSQINELLDEYGYKEVHNRISVLLVPFDQVCSLMDIKMRSVWDHARKIRKELPTSKTVLKYLSDESVNIPIKNHRKFVSLVSIPRRSADLFKFQIENGYCASAATGWLGFWEMAGINSVAFNYWEKRLYEISDLSGRVIPSFLQQSEQFNAYNSSDVVVEIGCPACRQLFPDLLEKLSVDESQYSKKLLPQLIAADSFATLLRMAAWLVAESQIFNWESHVKDGTQNDVLLAWVIPKWSEASQDWTKPIETVLQKLASSAGLSKKRPGPITYLGKIWAANDGVEDASKIRLLRNWVQLKGGRPSFEMILDLIKVCTACQRNNGFPSAEEANWLAAYVFRFAETMSLLIRDMQKGGWPRDLIISMLGVYEAEYQTARRLMGKPIEN